MKSASFSERLIQVREAKEFSQKEMVEQLRMKRPSCNYYEHGREMKVFMIVELCAIRECSTGWLIGVEEDGQHLLSESPLPKRLKEVFNALSHKGQRKVVSYAEDLIGNTEYTLVAKKRIEDSSLNIQLKEGAA